jgi:hypothetical protein
MPKVAVELWLWMGEKPAPPLRMVSPMRSVLEITVAPGTTVRALFESVAREVPQFRAHVIAPDGNQLQSHLSAVLNGCVVRDAEFYGAVLSEGDSILVFRQDVGG